MISRFLNCQEIYNSSIKLVFCNVIQVHTHLTKTKLPTYVHLYVKNFLLIKVKIF